MYYLVSDVIVGVTLADQLRVGGLDFFRAAQLIAQVADVESFYREASRIRERLVGTYPTNYTYRHQLAACHRSMSALQRNRGDINAAIRLAGQAREIWEFLVRMKREEHE